MSKREGYGATSLILVVISIISLLFGVLWLSMGIADENSDLVLRGSFSLIFGAAFGAVANFLK